MALGHTNSIKLRRAWLAVALLLALLGVIQVVASRATAPVSVPTILEARSAQSMSAGAARLDGPAFHYSPGWSITSEGADPAEPADPDVTPSGTLTFTYTGHDLALLLAVGDYRGHIYLTVDGEPANLLPRARGHEPPAPPQAGYKPLYAPELATSEGPGEQWIPVHHAASAGPHLVAIELWRGWGQTPLRAVAVDASLPAPWRPWPGVTLLVAALWCAWPLWLAIATWLGNFLRRAPATLVRGAQFILSARVRGLAAWLGAIGAAMIGVAMALHLWWLCAAGVMLLGAAGVVRPALWYAALLFALPFYFRFTLPLLPSRAVNLVDAGVFLGMGIALLHAAAVTMSGGTTRTRFTRTPLLLLAMIASWALISASGATHLSVALREWRTLFLMALTLAAGLTLTLYVAEKPRNEIVLLVGGWLAGAAILSTAALLLYPAESVIIPAEGVARLRAFYGSPNNLALYLERTLAVCLALALFGRVTRMRPSALVISLPQAAALVLTFSRGALFVALPALILTLWCAGFFALRAQGRSTRILWWLGAPVLIVALALVPFLATERFRDWASLAQGTGFLRLNLWRSAWQMTRDHPLLGVGPDNFLYAYRSGYILPQAWMEPNLNHPHTWLLDWWTRLGLPGLVLGVAFWLSIVIGLARKLRVDDGMLALTVGLLAATVTALAHGLVDVSYALPDLMAVWALFAVLSSVRLGEMAIGNTQ